MDVDWAHCAVVGGRVVLGEVVSEIAGAFVPVDSELVLVHRVADPVEAHVDCFGAALFDSVVDDAFGCFVVGLDGCRTLFVAQEFQCCS